MQAICGLENLMGYRFAIFRIYEPIISVCLIICIELTKRLHRFLWQLHAAFYFFNSNNIKVQIQVVVEKKLEILKIFS